jgi:acetyltransferase-like isoleucine patch superfamily enzyme
MSLPDQAPSPVPDPVPDPIPDRAPEASRRAPHAAPGLPRSVFRALRPVQELIQGLKVAMRRAALRELEREGVATMGRFTIGVPKINFWRNPATGRVEGGRVRIGSFCSIGEEVEIFLGGEHHMDWVTTYALRVCLEMEGAWADGHPTSKGDVTIGNDVYVGVGSKILSGVTLGDGSVVGAYSVVARDVRPYSINAGAPAREIRMRFADEQIAELCKARWWDWPLERIKQSADLLCSPNVDEFIRRAHG